MNEKPNKDWRTANPRFYDISRGYQMKLRQNPTSAEKVLWEVVRGKKLGGFKFRRQHIIDVFIVDFVCLKARLVIEVDGRIHNFQKEYDEARTKHLNAEGFNVIRFTNDEVLNQTIQVKEKIMIFLDNCS